ncbi:hypothetical protein COOONC_13219 [Cooperia oncophora]
MLRVDAAEGCMDILLMVSYFIFGTLRLSELCNGLFWTYKEYYIATWCYNQTYVSAILRCFGVLIINTSHRWILPILQWAVPTAYSVPLLVFSNATFKSSENMEVLIERQSITVRNMTMLLIFYEIFMFQA